MGCWGSYCMQDLKSLPWLTPKRADILWGQPLKNRLRTSRTISQEMGMFAVSSVYARAVHRLNSHYFGFPWQCNIQRNGDWCVEWQSRIQEWHSVVFSVESRFCVQYSDGRVRGRRFQEDRTSPTCIPYRHSEPAFGVIVWKTIGYTTRTSLVRIESNLNADRHISDNLCPVVVSYFRGLPNAIFQQVNARRHVARHVLTFLDTQGIWLLPCSARSPDLSPNENIWLWVAERLARHPSPAKYGWWSVA